MLLLALAACAQPAATGPSIVYLDEDAPFLRLNTTDHSTDLTRAGITSDGETVVTGARDYTIKLWQASSMRLLRTIRPPVSRDFVTAPGSGIRAVDISPDGKMIAAAGQVDNAGVRGTWRMFIFDAVTGEMLASPFEGSAFVADIAFSKDGSLVALGAYADAGDPINGLWVWETGKWDKPIYRDHEYGGETSKKGARINGLAFNSQGVLVTTSYDGFLRRYENVRQASPPRLVAAPPNLYPYDVQFSPDGSLALVGFFNDQLGAKPPEGQPTIDAAAIVYFAADLSEVRRLDVSGLPDGQGGTVTATAVRGVNWSRSGRYVYANLVQYVPGHADEQVRRWSAADGVIAGSYDQCTDENVLQILPRGAEGAILFNVEACHTIIGDDGAVAARTPGDRFPFDPEPMPEDNGPGTLLVSANGGEIYFQGGGPDQSFGFSLEPGRRGVRRDLSPATKSAFDGFVAQRGGIGLTDWSYTQHPKFNGRDVGITNKTNLTNNWSYAVDVASKSDYAIIGANFTLDRYSRADKFDWRISTNARVVRVNITPQENAVVVFYSDGVIRWHDPANGQIILSLFVDRTGTNWVMWTQGGYYEASGGGEDLIGWHLNNGPNRAATWYGASRYRDKFYSPAIIDDIVRALMSGTPIDSMTGPSRAALSNDYANSIVRAAAPPVPLIESARIVKVGQQSQMEVAFTVESPSGKPVTGYRIIVDGATKVDIPGPIAIGQRIVATVQVNSGERGMSVVASTDDGFGHAKAIGIPSSSGDPLAPFPEPRKPNLRALVVGVAEYRNAGPGLPNLTYPTADAKAFSDFLRTQANTELFGEVTVAEVTGPQVTRDRIESELQTIRNASENDFVVVFLAGHGWRDRFGNFYYLTHETEPVEGRIARTSVNGDEIFKAIRQSRARIALFLDTCQAGDAKESKLQMELNGLEKEVFIFSSSSDTGLSYENKDWGHGAFTLALLEALGRRKPVSLGVLSTFSDNGDKLPDQTGSLSSLTLFLYLKKRIPKLTQHEAPVQVPVFFSRGPNGDTPDRDLFWVGAKN